MPRKGPGPDRPGSSRDGEGETDRDIDAGIDAVNKLRTVMWGAGLLACADALDEAFACCLRDYVARQDQKRVDEGGTVDPDPDNQLN